MTSLLTERTRVQLDALASAGLDIPTYVDGALQVLARAVPFSAACVATTDPATGLVTSATKWGSMQGVTPGEDERWAYHEYFADDVYDYRDLARRPGGVLTTHHETDGDPLRSRRYEEFFRKHWGVTDELRSAATTDGVMWGFFALFRDDGDRARTFSQAEMEFVSGLSGRLARGVRSGLITSLVTAEISDPSGPAVIVVNESGDVLQANLSARRHVAELGGGPLGSAPLPLPLQSVVKVALRSGPDHGVTVPRVRMRTPQGRWIVVSASPLQTFGVSPSRVVAVTIEDAGAADVLPLLVSAFGLTAREQDVVRLVLRGVSTAEIARTLHLSAYTVQDHLKSVFDKVGVRSRRELTARVFVEEYAPRLAQGQAPGPSGWFTQG